MDERDQRTFGAGPRLLVNEPHAARLQPIEHGADVVHAQRDVVNAGTALLDIFRDGGVAGRRLEQLDGGLADRNEPCAHPLRGDLLGRLDVESKCIPKKGERLVDILDRNSHMVQDGDSATC